MSRYTYSDGFDQAKASISYDPSQPDGQKWKWATQIGRNKIELYAPPDVMLGYLQPVPVYLTR